MNMIGCRHLIRYYLTIELYSVQLAARVAAARPLVIRRARAVEPANLGVA
jgi:hypothetical protein